ncbi:MAG: DEAD/DEAH box helicase [Thermoplasmatales archaeon]|nr:DEAD/DEAH box helicase [Thermoplasmatales archaeon]
MLDEKIIEGLKELGFKKLTSPQIKAIPYILKGKNCIIVAPTGLGKTEAALLPIFHLLTKEKREGISILYITPLRALNRDLLKRTFLWSKKLGIKIAVRHGDTPESERRSQRIKPPDMLITTPETLQILLVSKKLREKLKNVKWVIIDEVHELMDERGAQLTVGLERLEELANFQRIAISATIGNPEEIAKIFCGEDCEIINVAEEKKIEISVEMPKINFLEKDIKSVLNRIKEEINAHKATLLFVNTRDSAEMLTSMLHEIGANTEIHHGSLSKEVRIEAEEKFKSGEVKSLVCTSSLELGIDIGHADFVIQYNSPRQVTRILQRVGRSGHGVGRTSRGKIIATNSEEYEEALVISKRAIENKIEEIKMRKNPLIVLANQIIAIAVEYGSISEEKAYEVIKRAYPFRELSKELFIDVLNQIVRQGVVAYREGEIKRKKKSLLYFLDNISMIPDEKSYDVIDISSNKRIGKIDESFVTNYCCIGFRFIMKGRAWEVVNIEKEVYVTPSSKTDIVPDWTGEEISVPFEIAREVGALRRLVEGGEMRDEIIEDEIKRQKSQGFIVPNDRIITIEREGSEVYITTHFGTKVNETLSKIIGALISQKRGEFVTTGSDAYRIHFKNCRLRDEEIREIILKIPPRSIEPLLRIILKNSSFIKWELLKVARKFGLIEKDASHDKIFIEKLIDVFDGTPFMEEVINKTIWDRMDIENTEKALEMIRNGEIKIISQGLSPVTREIELAMSEFLKPSVDKLTLEALRKRLEETRIKIFCLNCSNSFETRVYRCPAVCPKCSSKMIAVLKKEFKDKKSLVKNASLVAEYGKKAILVMAGHGIGADTAGRILAMQKEGDELLKEILKAEITYARTKRFWA